MKHISKNIWVMAALFAALYPAAAQSHYYGLVGDTIFGQSPIYHYNWYPALDSLGRADSTVVCQMVAGGSFMKQVRPGTVKVIGVASSVSYITIATGVHECDAARDTDSYYFLYDATPGGLVELKRVNWMADYNTHPIRYWKAPCTVTYNLSSSCDSLVHPDWIVPMREYYFDTAFVLSDSFYVGLTYNMRSLMDNKTAYELMSYYAGKTLNYGDIKGAINGPLCRMAIPMQNYASRDPNDTTQFTYSRSNEYLCVFPIIEVDTVGLAYDTALFTCPAPGAPQVLSRSANMARLRWGGAGSDEWQLSLMAVGDSAAERLTVLTDTVAYLYGLSPDTAYIARVRARCHNANYQGWSPWSPAATLPALAAIGAADDSTAFSLAPNPATDRLDVALRQAAAEGTALEVADLTGRPLLWHPLAAGTREAALDLGGLPAGLYLLRLHTPSGTATRRFVVAAR